MEMRLSLENVVYDDHVIPYIWFLHQQTFSKQIVSSTIPLLLKIIFFFLL